MAKYSLYIFALCISVIAAAREKDEMARELDQTTTETGQSQNLCDCPNDSKPVCMTKVNANMERKYAIAKNRCEFECKKSKDQSIELTGESDILQSACCGNCSRTTINAVCASNGVTYDRPCAFYCEIRPTTVAEDDLELIAQQECEDIAPNCDSCLGTKDYICGTNGITYMNSCDLSCNQKVFKDLAPAYRSTCAPQHTNNSSLYMMTMSFDPSRKDFGIYPQNSGYLIQSPQWLICMVKKFLQEM